MEGGVERKVKGLIAYIYWIDGFHARCGSWDLHGGWFVCWNRVVDLPGRE